MGEALTEPGGGVRLFVEAPLGAGVRIELPQTQTHYLVRVMRGRAGDRLSLFNGRDGEWSAEIAEIRKRSCIVSCKAQVGPQIEVPDLWLVFAPIKKTPADYVVQKATELGVRLLQPVLTRRTIARRVNMERMRANAVEAAEQSGRTDVPEIREATEFERLIDAWPRERKLLFCDEGGDAPSVLHALQRSAGGPWAILTGPEGGFDPAERSRLRVQPFVVPVTLGSRILRADTAALAAVAIWQAALGDPGRAS